MDENHVVAIRQVTAAHFPAPRQPAVVRARWHGPPVSEAAGVIPPAALDLGGHRP